MACVAAGDKPLFTAKAPKMIPNGIAPTTRGNVALTPAQNSDLRLGCMDWSGNFPPQEKNNNRYDIKKISAPRHHLWDAAAFFA
jgi:hypothetical protein